MMENIQKNCNCWAKHT